MHALVGCQKRCANSLTRCFHSDAMMHSRQCRCPGPRHHTYRRNGLLTFKELAALVTDGLAVRRRSRAIAGAWGNTTGKIGARKADRGETPPAPVGKSPTFLFVGHPPNGRGFAQHPVAPPHAGCEPSDAACEILIEIASFAFARPAANVFETAAARPRHRRMRSNRRHHDNRAAITEQTGRAACPHPARNVRIARPSRCPWPRTTASSTRRRSTSARNR